MPLANVETFESDITEEIRGQETTMTNIIASHRTEEVLHQAEKKNTMILLFVFILISVAIVGIGVYFLTQKTGQPLTPTPTTTFHPSSRTPTVLLATILPETNAAIERYVPLVQKQDAGYILSITDYSSVYGYLLYNETSFGNEALNLFQEVSTSTPVFFDITQAGQDMRAFLLENRRGVVYGFIGTTTLLISPSVEELMMLRNDILTK